MLRDVFLLLSLWLHRQRTLGCSVTSSTWCFQHGPLDKLQWHSETLVSWAVSEQLWETYCALHVKLCRQSPVDVYLGGRDGTGRITRAREEGKRIYVPHIIALVHGKMCIYKSCSAMTQLCLCTRLDGQWEHYQPLNTWHTAAATLLLYSSF